MSTVEFEEKMLQKEIVAQKVIFFVLFLVDRSIVIDTDLLSIEKASKTIVKYIKKNCVK